MSLLANAATDERGMSTSQDSGGAPSPRPTATVAAVPDGAKPALWADGPIPVGVCYAGCMFVCGNVLIGIGDALVEMAHANGIQMSDTGNLFLARGVGQILATLFCADLYAGFHGNGILMVCCVGVGAMWLVVSMISNELVLLLWFFATGLMTATLDIGTQILTRREYGAEAGPWLTANTFCFATAGLLAPLVDYITSGLLQQCAVYAGFAILLGALTLFVSEDCYLIPTRRQQDASSDTRPKTLGAKVRASLFAWADPVYNNDALLALMIFFTIGGQNMMSNYLETFILITGVTPVHVDSLMLSLFWGSMVISRLVAMFKLQPGLKTKPLIAQMQVMFVGCMLASVPLWLTPNLYGQPDCTSVTHDPNGAVASEERCSGPQSYCWMKTASPPYDYHETVLGDATYYWSTACEGTNPSCPAGTSATASSGGVSGSAMNGRVGGAQVAQPHSDADCEPDHAYWPLFAAYLTYGFFCGPILGYIFDFHNRVTVSKERGSAILILGLNLGSSLVPWLFTVVLQAGAQGASMPIVEMASVIAPALIMFHVVSKNKATVNGEAKAAQPQPEPEAGFSTEVRTKAAAVILSSCVRAFCAVCSRGVRWQGIAAPGEQEGSGSIYSAAPDS